MALSLPPLSAYVHIPWCVKKCPYCDFNSHALQNDIPHQEYVASLREDLLSDLHWAQGRRLQSIFFGGGTPSLMPAQSIGSILELLEESIGFETDIEITLEANPGTVEHGDFAELKSAGINRLSMGVQSFSAEHLKTLGRIHSNTEAKKALEQARNIFDNFNIDLMHGLPNQSVDQALADIVQAISFEPTHLSWYQLTIEQNTEFYSRPPTLPQEDTLYSIFSEGVQKLQEAGYGQYEISAYARAGRISKHNQNYWLFGDYLALGAGAHGKITLPNEARILRYQKTRLPKDYLEHRDSRTSQVSDIDSTNLPLEFMMNGLRLNQGFDIEVFEARTGISFCEIEPIVSTLQSRGLIEIQSERVRTSPLGRNFLNNVLEYFS